MRNCVTQIKHIVTSRVHSSLPLPLFFIKFYRNIHMFSSFSKYTIFSYFNNITEILKLSTNSCKLFSIPIKFKVKDISYGIYPSHQNDKQH